VSLEYSSECLACDLHVTRHRTTCNKQQCNVNQRTSFAEFKHSSKKPNFTLSNKMTNSMLTICPRKIPYTRNYLPHLEEVNRIPLTPPNVERATNIGIIHAMTPYRRSANTWTTQSRLQLTRHAHALTCKHAHSIVKAKSH